MATNVEAWTLLSLGLLFVILRVYVRWTMVGPRNFQLDDYLMPLAGIVFIMETVAAYLVGALYNGLTNSYMTDSERAALSPSSTEYYNRQMGSKVQIIGWSFYAAILWLVKFSLAIFYARLTTGLSHMLIRVKIAYVLLGATWIATEAFILFGCQPFSSYWQINPDPGHFCQPTLSPFYVIPLVCFNVATDLYLLSIPLPMLWTVNIGIKRKISLMGLFSGALFVIMASVIRAIVISTAGKQGAISGSQWACRETFVSLVVSNLPIIHPLVRRVANKVGLSMLFSTTARTTGNKYPLASHELTRNTNQARSGLRSKANQTLVSASHNEAWESDEQVLVPGTRNGSGGKIHQEITVIQETVVQTEAWRGHDHDGREGATQPEWEMSRTSSGDGRKHGYSMTGSPPR